MDLSLAPLFFHPEGGIMKELLVVLLFFRGA